MRFSLLLIFCSVVAQATPTSLTVVTISETAAALADNAADITNGNRVRNPGADVFLVLRNIHNSSSATVTISPRASTYQVPGFGLMAKDPLAVTLAAGDVKHVGPFNARVWNDTDGYVQLAASGAASSSVRITPLRALRP